MAWSGGALTLLTRFGKQVFLFCIDKFYVQISRRQKECDAIAAKGLARLRRHQKARAASLQLRYRGIQLFAAKTQMMQPPAPARECGHRAGRRRRLNQLDRDRIRLGKEDYFRLLPRIENNR